MKVISFTSKDFNDIWEKVMPFLEEAMTYSDGKFSDEDLKKGIETKEYQLWVLFDENDIKAVLISSIINYPKEKRLYVIFFAAKLLKMMFNFREILDSWARHNKCNAIEICGRPGWEKFLPQEGYEKTHVVLRRRLWVE